MVGGHCEDCLPYKRESYLTKHCFYPLSMGETSVGHHSLLCQALPASYSCASLDTVKMVMGYLGGVLE